MHIRSFGDLEGAKVHDEIAHVRKTQSPILRERRKKTRNRRVAAEQEFARSAIIAAIAPFSAHLDQKTDRLRVVSVRSLRSKLMTASPCNDLSASDHRSTNSAIMLRPGGSLHCQARPGRLDRGQTCPRHGRLFNRVDHQPHLRWSMLRLPWTVA